MKRIFTLLMAAVTSLSLAACSAKEKETSSAPNVTTSAQSEMSAARLDTCRRRLDEPYYVTLRKTVFLAVNLYVGDIADRCIGNEKHYSAFVLRTPLNTCQRPSFGGNSCCLDTLEQG